MSRVRPATQLAKSRLVPSRAKLHLHVADMTARGTTGAACAGQFVDVGAGGRP